MRIVPWVIIRACQRQAEIIRDGTKWLCKLISPSGIATGLRVARLYWNMIEFVQCGCKQTGHTLLVARRVSELKIAS